jgi:hypothetical protein
MPEHTTTAIPIYMCPTCYLREHPADSPVTEADKLASGRIAAWLRDFGMEHNNPQWTDDLKMTLRLAGIDLKQWGIELKEPE